MSEIASLTQTPDRPLERRPILSHRLERKGLEHRQLEGALQQVFAIARHVCVLHPSDHLEDECGAFFRLSREGGPVVAWIWT